MRPRARRSSKKIFTGELEARCQVSGVRCQDITDTRHLTPDTYFS
jgi:hypothetical protein